MLVVVCVGSNERHLEDPWLIAIAWNERRERQKSKIIIHTHRHATYKYLIFLLSCCHCNLFGCQALLRQHNVSRRCNTQIMYSRNDQKHGYNHNVCMCSGVDRRSPLSSTCDTSARVCAPHTQP